MQASVLERMDPASPADWRFERENTRLTKEVSPVSLSPACVSLCSYTYENLLLRFCRCCEDIWGYEDILGGLLKITANWLNYHKYD